jgi:tetratricopeptide (TPR) repeat protein
MKEVSMHRIGRLCLTAALCGTLAQAQENIQADLNKTLETFQETFHNAILRSQYAEAEQLSKAVLQMAEQYPADLEVAGVLQFMGLDYLFGRKMFAQAEPLLQKALAMEEKAEPKGLARVYALNWLGGTYYYLGKCSDAEGLAKRELTIREQSAEHREENVAIPTTNVASLLQGQGKASEGEALLKQVRGDVERAEGPYSRSTYGSMYKLALFYQPEGKDEQARPLIKRALALDEAISKAQTQTFVALNYEAQGKYAEAEQAYKQDVGPFAEPLETRLTFLAWFYDRHGNKTEAETSYKSAMDSLEKSGKQEAPTAAFTLQKFGEFYITQKKYTEAEPLLRRALALREQPKSPAHQYEAPTLESYARALQGLGKTEEAATMHSRADAAVDELLSTISARSSSEGAGKCGRLTWSWDLKE